MTELVVVSGKGGTGKTSLVGSLAALSRDAVLVDCDVDASNLHLIVRHEVQQMTPFTASKRAAIDEESCNNCGVCLEHCRFDAVRHQVPGNGADRERHWIDPYACDGCGVCVRHCPEQAIDFREVESGRWYLSETPYGPLVHARLGVAQANSGKLVSLLRREARKVAERRRRNLILLDGPPGIGCPVIASITGVAYVLIVTEPSISALNDMERLLQLALQFNIPAGICVNRSDINPALCARIEEFAAQRDVAVLGRIPYDPAITMAQLAGVPVIEHLPQGVTRNITNLWSNLTRVIGESLKSSGRERVKQ